MKKIDYQIIIHARNGGKTTEHFDNEDDRANRVVDLSRPANAGDEIERIQLVEEHLNEKSFVKDVAFIASIITAEFYRPLMIKTLLSKEETHNLIVNVVIDVYHEMKSSFPGILDPSAPPLAMILYVNNTAKKIIWEKHNVKI